MDATPSFGVSMISKVHSNPQLTLTNFLRDIPLYVMYTDIFDTPHFK